MTDEAGSFPGLAQITPEVVEIPAYYRERPTPGTFYARALADGLPPHPSYPLGSAAGVLIYFWLGYRETFERAFEAGFNLDLLDPGDYGDFSHTIQNNIVADVADLVTREDLIRAAIERGNDEYTEEALQAKQEELRLEFAWATSDYAREGFEYGWKWKKVVASRYGARSVPPPPARPGGATPREAEHIAADWIRYLGDTHVRVTQAARDGGIDVEGTHSVAQVKHYAGTFIGPKDVRELYGVAIAARKLPIFLTTSDYTETAKQFARDQLIALFTFSIEEGTLRPVNTRASAMRRTGIEALAKG